MLRGLAALCLCAGGGNAENVPVRSLSDAAQRPRRFKLRGGSGAGAELKVNLCLGGKARMSSTSGKKVASMAIDGSTHGFYESPLQIDSVAQTNAEADPWWEVDFGAPHRIRSLQIHFPRRQCEGYWQRLQMINCASTPAETFAADKPLMVHLLDAGGHTTESRRFNRFDPVILQSFGSSTAQRIRIQLPGADRVLSLAEVLVEGGASDCAAYCVHGHCIDRTCVCKPDWFGVDCSLNTRAAWRYLPFEAKPARNWWNEAMAQRFEKALSATQQPRECNEKTARLQQVRYQAGFGSNMFELSGLMTQAFEAKVAFVPGRMNFMQFSNKFCAPEQRLDKCFFEPWTKCTEYNGGEKEEPMRGHDHEGFMHAAPPYEMMGVFWYRAMFIRYMTRISAKSAAAIKLEAIKRQIGYKHPIIGVHIRHTDACHTTKRAGRCKRFQAYVDEVQKMRKLYGIDRAFVATDDPEVIKEIKAYAAQRQPDKIQFVYVTGTDREQLAKGSTEDIEVRLRAKGSTVDAGKMVLDALADMMLLADADVYIGHLQSNLSRLSLLISTLKKKGIPPFISMDGAWCPHWRMCCDVHPITGESTLC